MLTIDAYEIMDEVYIVIRGRHIPTTLPPIDVLQCAVEVGWSGDEVNCVYYTLAKNR